jgi:hypothetical protein
MVNKNTHGRDAHARPQKQVLRACGAQDDNLALLALKKNRAKHVILSEARGTRA